MTRSVADAALLMDVMSGPDSRDRHSLRFPNSPSHFLRQLAEDKRDLSGLGSPGRATGPAKSRYLRTSAAPSKGQ